MPRLEFWLGNDDIDRLFAIKNNMGKDEISGSEFARELLEKELLRLHPRVPEFDENGEVI